ncbi:hypothetical protein BpHYR1_029384 [Brachionus plicatilis]|uniref:Uncharacterized protein n=1 Tax=Brachionus plicatilis TaxID=10195 RepID=A0A3M7PAI5_BRAPC|nr:hypothetical protein BpHYR1_029384 [Brachionus plicatilis]
MGQMTPILLILHSKHLKSHLTPFGASSFFFLVLLVLIKNKISLKSRSVLSSFDFLTIEENASLKTENKLTNRLRKIEHNFDLKKNE